MTKTVPDIRCNFCGAMLCGDVAPGSLFTLPCKRCRALWRVEVDAEGVLDLTLVRKPTQDVRRGKNGLARAW